MPYQTFDTIVDKEHSRDMRLSDMVRKIIILKRLYRAFRQHRVYVLTQFQEKYKFRGQNKYALEYMLLHPTSMIKQGDLLWYCDKRRNEDTMGVQPNYKDNSRQIESLRKNKVPNCWKEIRVKGELYFIYLPELLELVTEEVIENTRHKRDGFSPGDIRTRMLSADSMCELTNLPISEGHLAADHWNPKEGGGESTIENCVILNKLLNEKKNNHEPVAWFCKSLLSNFLNICRRTGMDLENVKVKLIDFIREF